MINPTHSFLYLIKSAIFFFIYGIFKYIPTPVGDICRYAVLKLFLKEIKTCWIKDGVTLWFPERIRIGRNTSLNEFVVINGAGNVDIGDDVLIGHRTSIVSDSHGFDDLSKKIYLQNKKSRPIKIKNNVFIGCNVTVLPGVTISEGSVIGAGSVVTRDIPTNSVVAGNPAKVIRIRGSQK